MIHLNNRYLKYFVALLALLALVVIWSRSVVTIQAADATWSAKYWNNRTMTGDPILQRSESDLNYDWGGGSPAVGIVNSDEFSAYWKRSVYFPAGNYRFTATTDDGMRVWVDGALLLDSWSDSQAHSISGDLYLNAGDHLIEVRYYEVGGQAVARLSWAVIGNPTIPPGNVWKGEYFNNKNLSGTPALVRDDTAINFSWEGGSPATGIINSDSFSVRWSRFVTFTPGRYRFTVLSDDGVRLWVNNQLIIDAWNNHPMQTFQGEIDLPNGTVPIRLEYYENAGGALVSMSWAPATAVPQPTPIPTPIPSSLPTGIIGIVQSAQLNVRSGPGLQYDILSQLSRGQTITLAGYRSTNSSWVMLQLNGNIGWVSGLPDYLWVNVPVNTLPVWTGATPGNPQPPSGTATATVAYVYYLNIRTGPGTNYNSIKAMPAGTTVTLLGRSTGASWAKVQLGDGTIGWMSASKLIPSVAINSLPVVN